MHLRVTSEARSIGDLIFLFCFLVPLAAFIYVFYREPITLLVLIPASLFIWLKFIKAKKNKEKLNSLGLTRASGSICNFAGSFDCRNVDTWILRAVYEGLSGYADIPIHADDHIIEDLLIDEETYTSELIPDIAEKCHRSLDGCNTNPHFKEIEMVRGLVNFLNRQPIVKAS